MNPNLKINKPKLISIGEPMDLFNRDSNIREAIRTLESGRPVVISEFYNNGLLLLKNLKYHLQKKFPNKTFKEQRDYRAAYHELSNLILIEIKDYKLVVNKAPFIGWIKKLYPESKDFLLSFPQVQGLNSSWQWYENGILIPVLRNKVHPYYGTYFPTRFDHIILFDNWLKRYEGPKKTAIDVGVGSGILSLQMVQHGFQKVFATDTNPNAIVGLTEFMGDSKLSRKIELDFAPFFGKFEKPTELIVFNPPWLPMAKNKNNVDAAIYYDENLFPEFFAEAKKRLLPDGKLVLIFSNLAQITNVTKEHPIEKEIAEGGRFKLEICLNKKVKLASKITKRDQHWRELEEVELWVLVHA